MAFGVTNIVPFFNPANVDTNEKLGFTSGYYVGTGAATAQLLDSGLKVIRNVWMDRVITGYTGATTDGTPSPRGCIAAGTVGSFYPILFEVPCAAAAQNALGMGAGATYSWLALGVKK